MTRLLLSGPEKGRHGRGRGWKIKMASDGEFQFTIFPDGEVAVTATSRVGLQQEKQLLSKPAIRRKKTSLPYENMLNVDIVHLPLTALLLL